MRRKRGFFAALSLCLVFSAMLLMSLFNMVFVVAVAVRNIHKSDIVLTVVIAVGVPVCMVRVFACASYAFFRNFFTCLEKTPANEHISTFSDKHAYHNLYVNRLYGNNKTVDRN